MPALCICPVAEEPLVWVYASEWAPGDVGEAVGALDTGMGVGYKVLWNQILLGMPA